MNRFAALPYRMRLGLGALVAVLTLGGVALGVTLDHRSGTSRAVSTASAAPPRSTTGAGAKPPATAAPGSAATPAATVATAPGCPRVAGGPPAAGLAANFATALAFSPDGRLFFAERGGTIRVVLSGVVHTFATVATMTTEPDGSYSERGLLGLAISPAYTSDHAVFAMYAATDHAHMVVARWTDCGGDGVGMTTIVSLPSGNDCCHKGGRLAFGPDGKLYVTLGEEHTPGAAQNTDDVRGKVLRYNPDGSIPADNPFGSTDPVWAYGLRNPFGIAFARGGQLLVTSNGPSGDVEGGPGTGYDVAVTIHRGGGYQWPLCYGYSHPNPGGGSCRGQPGPDWSSEGGPAVVPTGAAFVSAAGPAAYAGRFVFCTLSGGMRILSSGSPGTVAPGPANCKLDVKEGPGHTLYYSDETSIYRMG